MIRIAKFEEFKDKELKQKLHKSWEKQSEAIALFILSTTEISVQLRKVLIAREEFKTSHPGKPVPKHLNDAAGFITGMIKQIFRDTFGHEIIEGEDDAD